MYKAALLCDADVGVLATREDNHPANELAYRAWQRWRENGSSSMNCDIDLDVVDDYIRTQSVEPYFHDFFDFIFEQKLLFGIVTQRMGRIVETILRRQNLDRIPVFANHVEVEPFTIRLSFPHYNMLECDHCPSCNLFHMKRFRRPDVPLIFVGEKNYDLCAAASADLVFARGDLLERCRKEGVACEPIANLRDVERILTQMICKEQLQALPLRDLDQFSPLPPSPNGNRDGQAPRS
jgi:2-hydroxy-3-keto-5-methylthiopentenyl-1-phosphate phosphatase